MRPTQPVGTGVSIPEVRRKVLETDLSPASSIEDKNGGTIRSLCFYSTALNCIITYRNKFTFT
jgi:hypothetical protein